MSVEKVMAKLSPPWYSYQRQVLALFGGDPEVRVRDLHQVDQCNYTLFILVRNEVKARAIRALLPRTVEISNAHVTTRIFIPGEQCEVEPSKQVCEAQLLEDAFTGNPLFDRIDVHGYGNIKWSYCIFKKEVLQFWNDDLSNFYGLHSTLAETIARDILTKEITVQFCTGVE